MEISKKIVNDARRLISPTQEKVNAATIKTIGDKNRCNVKDLDTALEFLA